MAQQNLGNLESFVNQNVAYEDAGLLSFGDGSGDYYGSYNDATVSVNACDLGLNVHLAIWKRTIRFRVRRCWCRFVRYVIDNLIDNYHAKTVDNYNNDDYNNYHHHRGASHSRSWKNGLPITRTPRETSFCCSSWRHVWLLWWCHVRIWWLRRHPVWCQLTDNRTDRRDQQQTKCQCPG